MKKIPTSELLELLVAKKNRTIEASLNNGVFNATHFLSFDRRKILDVGIDSSFMTWKPEEFIYFYSNAYWKIDQIV